jgi:hypothetical protein
MAGVINSLWIGDRLSTMEQLSISSFLRHGHEFHLYVYGPIQGVPRGTVVRDGNDILPSSRIFTYSRKGTYSGFSNYFRYKLLLEDGGWWVDLDTVCLKPFDFPDTYVFSSEINDDGCPHVNCGMLKAPPGSPVMKYLWEECERIDPTELTWGQCGPQLMHRAVELFSLQSYIQPPVVFCPIPYTEWRRTIEPGLPWVFQSETRAVHLWNEMWRRSERDKDGRYDTTCLYEILKQQFLD